MAIVVQKFGGSSLADATGMRACARRVMEARGRGDRVVVVVSARGDTTDELLALADEAAGEGGKEPDAAHRREIDQLLATGEQASIALMAMTLRAAGVESVSLTGAQCGIRTEGMHTRSRIEGIDLSRLDLELKAERVVVVAGFQGINSAGDVATLGRGGSDTTAVALAAALGAAECQIFTDVDGVFTADPRLEPRARLLTVIGYDEMMEAAAAGSRVMHPQAVELGKKSGVPIRVLHSRRGSLGDGTLITSVAGGEGRTRPVATIALRTDVGRITLANLPNRPGLQHTVFDRIAEAGIGVDDIIQTDSTRTGAESIPSLCTIVFTLHAGDMHEVRPLIEHALSEIGRGRLAIDVGLAKISAVGAGMQGQPGAAATMFRALADADIKIENVSAGELKVSCIVGRADAEAGLRAVHAAFGLSAAECEGRAAVMAA